MSTSAYVTIVAHTASYLPSKPLLFAFTWACHLVLLLIVTAIVWLPNRKRFKANVWDCGQALLPFAVFCAMTEVYVPSIAEFFVNGMLLGLAIGLVASGRILIARKTKSDLLAFVWLVVSCHIAAAVAVVNPAENWM